MSLRRGALPCSRGSARGDPLQLLHLHEEGVFASDPAQGAVHAFARAALARDLYVQHEGSPASVLQGLRGSSVLYAAVAPRWGGRERTMSGWGCGEPVPHHTV